MFTDEHPVAPLAMVDLARRNVKLWTVEELHVFFRWMATFTRSSFISVVIFVRPGALYLNALSALALMNDFHIHLEYGTYAGPENRFLDPGLYMRDQREMIILAGISSGEPKQDWADTWWRLSSLHFQFVVNHDKDFNMTFPNDPKDIPSMETIEEKEACTREEEIRVVRCRAPRYDKGSVVGSWVNPDCKPHSV